MKLEDMITRFQDKTVADVIQATADIQYTDIWVARIARVRSCSNSKPSIAFT